MSHSALQILGVAFDPARTYWNSLAPIARRAWLNSIGYLSYSEYSFQYWDAIPRAITQALSSAYQNQNTPKAQA